MNPKSPKEFISPTSSPYPLSRDRGTNGTVYLFETKDQTKYKIVFEPDEVELPNKDEISKLSYSVALSRLDPKKAVHDPQIEATVQYAIGVVLEANPMLIITYQCSRVEGKHAARARRFKHWADGAGDSYECITFTNEADIYAAAIFKRDHPMAEVIRATFTGFYRDKA